MGQVTLRVGYLSPSVTPVGSLVPSSAPAPPPPPPQLAACSCLLLTLGCCENLPRASRGAAVAVCSAGVSWPDGYPRAQAMERSSLGASALVLPGTKLWDVWAAVSTSWIPSSNCEWGPRTCTAAGPLGDCTHPTPHVHPCHSSPAPCQHLCFTGSGEQKWARSGPLCLPSSLDLSLSTASTSWDHHHFQKGGWIINHTSSKPRETVS